MKTLVKLIGSVAFLATLSGSDATAQMVSGMHGQAQAKQPAPLHPRMDNIVNDGSGAVLGGKQDSGQGPGSHVIVDHLWPEPAGDLSDDIVIVPGAPFAVYIGPSQGQAGLLVDAGLVPLDGERALTLVPDAALGDDMSLYFESDGVIICLAGRDADTQYGDLDQVTLVGPGAGIQLGHGAALVAGDLRHGLSGEVKGDDRLGGEDGDRTRDQLDQRDGRVVSGTSTSVMKKKAPALKPLP